MVKCGACVDSGAFCAIVFQVFSSLLPVRVYDMTKLFVCQSVEWARDNGGLRLDNMGVAEIWHDECVGEFLASVYFDLTFAGFEVARGSTLFHQWNGAHFAQRFGVVASYDKLSDEDCAKIDRIIDQCAKQTLIAWAAVK